MRDAFVEPSKVFRLVPKRITRFTAAFLYPIGKLDHLVDRLLAIEAHDVVDHELTSVVVRFARLARQELDKQGNHHVRPALADQRQGAIKVEQDVADVRTRRKGRTELDQSLEGRSMQHRRTL